MKQGKLLRSRMYVKGLGVHAFQLMSTRRWFTLTHSTNSIWNKAVRLSAVKKIHKTLPENERKWLFWLSFLWVVSSDLRQAVSWSLLFIKKALWKYFTVHKCIIYRSGVAKIWIYKFNIYQAKNSAGFHCTEGPATFQACLSPFFPRVRE
jgi:hypothetical protein